SQIDTRELVLGDLTAVGVLSASPGLPGAIAAFTSGNVDPRPLVAATIGLDEVAEVLAGTRPTGAGPAPKIHIDPSRCPLGRWAADLLARRAPGPSAADPLAGSSAPADQLSRRTPVTPRPRGRSLGSV